MIDRDSSARAIADLGSGTILATIDIAAAPERVFAAITTPEQLVSWWGSDDTYRTETWEADLRVGGSWRATGRGADGSPFMVQGEFVEITAPERLVQTWRPDWDGGALSTITYTLARIDGGTRVTVKHDGLQDRPESCAAHSAGWERVLAWLRGHFAAPAAAPSFFLCRLLPPRPSFIADMTAEEAAIMQAHAQYWTTKLHERVAVVFGPVADPAGPWGLGVVRVRDRAELDAFEAADPAIRSGRGFRYDVLPMLQAVVAD